MKPVLKKQQLVTANDLKGPVLHLVNEWSSEGVGLQQHAGPQVRVFAAHQVARQALEQGVLIADLTLKEVKVKKRKVN